MELRNEVIESQKARTDLFKWKIILVAAIGAAGLGIGNTTGKNYNLLCLIPLVCVYVDILCSHMNLRIRTIGNFLRLSSHAGQGANEPGYEDFVEKARAMLISHTIVGSRRISAFSFEDFAQHFSSRHCHHDLQVLQLEAGGTGRMPCGR